VKNLIGTISFNQGDQMIRSQNGHREAFLHPLTQAQIQAKHLEHLLKYLGYGALPIRPIAVFTHPNVILENTANNANIVVSQQLAVRLTEVQKSFQPTQYKLRTLAHLLKSKHEPKRADLIKTYQLDQHCIRPGVWCPHCKKVIWILVLPSMQSKSSLSPSRHTP